MCRLVPTNLTMKVVLCLLLVALVHAAPKDQQKRLFLEDLDVLVCSILSTFSHATKLLHLSNQITSARPNTDQNLVGQLAHQLGDEPTEQTCEAACHGILMGETGLLHEACPLVCRSRVRRGVQIAVCLHIIIVMKFAVVLLLLLPLALAAPEKRFFVDSLLGLFDLDQLKAIVGKLAHQLGAEPTEQACEAVCHGVIAGETSLLHQGCPLVCRSSLYNPHEGDHRCGAVNQGTELHVSCTQVADDNMVAVEENGVSCASFTHAAWYGFSSLQCRRPCSEQTSSITGKTTPHGPAARRWEEGGGPPSCSRSQGSRTSSPSSTSSTPNGSSGHGA
ncbi:hypothetical protein C0Q70_10667 [Pomacea canaliculata]|uniref:Uncharacterized protein n=1 Tax=Pomacea canaliculata TaxID=400727 RepID=A0A2T7P3V0_POMCA|nr:hypothetical protein C0Q70_10667 [Pomacea canaliculata]